MKRRNWQADMNPMAGRIDTRSQSDPAVAAGMRGIHRDTGGNVIGGYTAEGSPLGTKKSVAAVGGSATPRLDAGVQTPRLDSNPRQPIVYGNAADRRAQDVSAARSVAADGGFGIGAQQREQQRAGRQSLFERMKTAGAGGVTPAMAKEAASLGVTRGGWRNALGKIPQPPASIAAVNAPPSVQTGVPPILATDQKLSSSSAAPKSISDVIGKQAGSGYNSNQQNASQPLFQNVDVGNDSVQILTRWGMLAKLNGQRVAEGKDPVSVGGRDVQIMVPSSDSSGNQNRATPSDSSSPYSPIGRASPVPSVLLPSTSSPSSSLLSKAAANKKPWRVAAR